MTQATPPMERIKNYVGGHWVQAETDEALEVRNPATGEILGLVPMSGAAQVEAAVGAAREAYPDWRATPPQERARYLMRFREVLDKHREELARLIVTDMGKTLEDACGEVQRGIENVETACSVSTLMMGYGLEDGAGRGIDEEVVHQPLGAFAGITPFNFPFMIALWFWPYAIATGNTYILKPSEQDPMTQQWVFQLIEEIGLPPGVLNLVNGGTEAVNALLDHPQIQGVSFVGSTKTARYIYARAAASGKRVQASGGAKNAAVVMPDADLETHLPTLVNSFFGAAGQRCLANSLIMPVSTARGAAVERVAAAAASLRVGDGLQPGVDIGPLASAAARDRVVSAIDLGIAEGATAVLDGRETSVPERPGGYFVGPTVLDGVQPGTRTYTEEIFGPVVGVTPVATLDDAISLINASPYGNGATIITESGAAARRFRHEVQAGNVGINIGVPSPVPWFPFGGAKDSFFGVLHPQGRDAVRFFTETKVVISRWTGADR